MNISPAYNGSGADLLGKCREPAGFASKEAGKSLQ